jgi:hypothetical protein
MNETHLASLDSLIAYHESSAAALRQARAVIAGDERGEAAQADVRLLTGPKTKQKRGKGKRTARDKTLKLDNRTAARPYMLKGEKVLAEIDGVEFEVAPMQAKLIEILAETDGYLTSAKIGEACGLSSYHAKFLVQGTNRLIMDAKCKAIINGYKSMGYRLESTEAVEE